MKIIRFEKLNFIPASHENSKSPGVVKKILLEKNDLIKGRIQMINWAKLPVNKSFQAHYHQDMEEVFIILNGKTLIKIDNEEEELRKGDAVVVPIGKTHTMKNISDEDVDYIALGISTGDNGKTVVV